ncbi:hypothetical protein JCM14635_04630 [Megalodesulfovibrio paquesii]
MARFKVFFNSIKGKIFTLFLVAFLVACGLTALNIVTLSTVSDRLQLTERYDDLLNAILEARRYEKNLLIYADAQDLEEGIDYLNVIDRSVRLLGEDIASVTGVAGLAAFQFAVKRYREEYLALGKQRAEHPSDRPPVSAKGEMDNARSAGKHLVDLAEELIRVKRARIHDTIFTVSLIPVAYLAVFLVFMAFLIHVIAQSLLKPLGLIGQITTRVAKGDFSPVETGSQHIEEVAGLIDALNRMGQELTAHQEDLLQARKIAALGTFTAGIAHELNNPINNIMLSAETLLELHGDTLDEDGREVARDILAQAERAAEIVGNLLNFSRTEKTVISPVAPEVVVKTSLALLRNQILISGLTIRVELAAGLPRVAGNLRLLQQVLLNLLLNAVQASPAGGAIAVETADAGEFVRITVRDSGPGISQENLSHIFEPFFTTKEVGKGTGLGLAVTYSIIKRHNGRIEVESEPGQGAAFHVFLPKSTPQQEQDIPAELQAAGAGHAL